MKISTHAPRTGSDKGIVPHSNRFVKNFNPRSPHGERPCLLYPKINQHYISTHAPRTGSDEIKCHIIKPPLLFQPTLPARGATGDDCDAQSPKDISTHAPRTGSDATSYERGYHDEISTHAPRTGSDAGTIPCSSSKDYFNPRSPHGERLYGFCLLSMEESISTHAPRTGSDALVTHEGKRDKDFNPRSPHGERRKDLSQGRSLEMISTHAPRTGSDGAFPMSGGLIVAFQPTLPARGATCRCF